MNALLLLLSVVPLLHGAAHDDQKISPQVRALFAEMNGCDTALLPTLEGKPAVVSKAGEFLSFIHMGNGYERLFNAAKKAQKLNKRPAFCMEKWRLLHQYTDSVLCTMLES